MVAYIEYKTPVFGIPAANGFVQWLPKLRYKACIFYDGGIANQAKHLLVKGFGMVIDLYNQNETDFLKLKIQHYENHFNYQGQWWNLKCHCLYHRHFTYAGSRFYGKVYKIIFWFADQQNLLGKE